MGRSRTADALYLGGIPKLTEEQKTEVEEKVREYQVWTRGKYVPGPTIKFAVGRALKVFVDSNALPEAERIRYREPIQRECVSFLFKFFALGKEKNSNSNPEGYIAKSIENFAIRAIEKALRADEAHRTSEPFHVRDRSSEGWDDYRERDLSKVGEELGFDTSQDHEAIWKGNLKTDRTPAKPQKVKPVVRVKPAEPDHSTLKGEHFTLPEEAIRLLQMFTHGDLLDMCTRRALEDAFLEDLAAEKGMTTEELVEDFIDLQWTLINACNPKLRQQKKRTLKFRPLRNVKRKERKERSLAEYVASPEWKGASNV